MGLERKTDDDGMSGEYPSVWHLSQVKVLVVRIPEKECGWELLVLLSKKLLGDSKVQNFLSIFPLFR